MNKRSDKHFSQHAINLANISIALVALVIAAGGGFFQLNQYLNDRHDRANTKVVYYSPPIPSKDKATSGGHCIGALTSNRGDAYRCFAGSEVSDPCFWVDYYIGSSKSYFYCPSDWQVGSKDKFLSVNNSEVERRYFDVASEQQRSSDKNSLPWLIELAGGTKCRLISGAVGTAYGDKGNIYGCDQAKYASVTNGRVSGGKYYFECKIRGETVFHGCFASRVVF